MKFYDLLLIMIMLNIFGAALTNSGAFGQMGLSAEFLPTESTSDDVEEMETGLNEAVEGKISGDNPIEAIFGLISNIIVKSYKNVLGPFERYIFWPKIMMLEFGIPSQIAWGFTILFNFIQIVGLWQFVTGRSFKQIE